MMDRNDRIRACYQHCCFRDVVNEKMAAKTFERFQEELASSNAARTSSARRRCRPAGASICGSC